MERVKKPVCIVLFLCGAVLACIRENPFHEDWRDHRFFRARLTGVKWKQQDQPNLTTSCDETPDSRDEALNLLEVAYGDCLDKAVHAVGQYAKEDLDAAYLTRYERRHDPVDLLRAMETAKGFNRALALEGLGLNREAIHAWDEVAREDSAWSSEGAEHRDILQRLPDPIHEWNPEALAEALERRDVVAVSTMARAFPMDAAQVFEKSDLRDGKRARLFATVLAKAGEHYPMAVVEAMERTRDASVLEQGLTAFKNKDYPLAVKLLERAHNPLQLAARYYVSLYPGSILPIDATLPHLRPEYRELASRIYTWRANLLEFDNRYLEAYSDYDRALDLAKDEPTGMARVLSRRSFNYAFIGDAKLAFREAHRAVSLLGRVVDTDARNTAYGAAALASRRLGYPWIALYYQNAAVEDVQRSVTAASAEGLAVAKRELVGALRARAEIHVELGRNDDAVGDLEQASRLAEAVDIPEYRDLFRMRILEVRGQAALSRRPAEAVAAFNEAIQLAANQDSTYRAMLHFERAAARRNAGDAQADKDLVTAMGILRDEVRAALAAKPEAISKPLWDPYFLRFRELYHDLIESRIAAGDTEGAFVYTELARAFEPMQILLQSRALPPGFQPIENVASLNIARASLPADTVILQYLVRPERTFIWVVTRERIVPVPQRATRAQVERWVASVEADIAGRQPGHMVTTMRAVYAELFREPLKLAGPSKTHIVIVPDESMLGLPFNALAGSQRDEGYLIERASVAISGSTSLYLYALAHDQQLSAERNPPVLLVSAPAFDLKRYPALPYANEEVDELARDYYSGAKLLTGSEATPGNFLSKARKAGIIHFAGHGLASAETPWRSRLVFAPHGQDSGELTAERLMKELPVLDRTRLVVLGACETAGGASVGPQGLAPLVRPFIGAGVPAVVGSLWTVWDASTKQLLVSLHCHYRHGDDVAVALRQAQLERLRESDTDHAMNWAAFQVVGYAASPYPPSVAQENPSSDDLCTQNPLHRPDGLHPQ